MGKGLKSFDWTSKFNPRNHGLKTIMDTFSKTLPDITGSDIVQGLSSCIANINPLGHISTALSTSFDNTVIIIILCFILYLLFQRWKKQQELKNEASQIASTVTHLQKQKGEM